MSPSCIVGFVFVRLLATFRSVRFECNASRYSVKPLFTHRVIDHVLPSVIPLRLLLYMEGSAHGSRYPRPDVLGPRGAERRASRPAVQAGRRLEDDHLA